MVGGVNTLDAPRSSPGVIRSVAGAEYPESPFLIRRKHVVPALDLRRNPALTEPPFTRRARHCRTGQPYPTFALLATLSEEAVDGDAGGAAIFPAVAADETDEPGVLGNLPRSRPGQRSAKRGGGARAAGSTRAKASTQSRASGAKRKPTAARKQAAPASRRARPRPQQPSAQPTAAPGDPLTAAVRAAGKVAELGLRTAGSLLRRLPGR